MASLKRALLRRSASAIAFALGKHSAAALVHCAFLLALPLLILAYARRAGFPRAGIGAALFVFASPVAGVTGTSAYNDLAITALLFACFYVLEIWTEETDRNLLVVAGILAGFCYGVKYTAFLAVPYALGRVAWKLRGDRKQLLRSTGLVCLCALVMVLPWIVKNVVVVQNPFSPFLNSLFPNPYVDPAFEKAYAAWMHRYAGLKSFADIPLEVTVRGWVLAGFLGPLFLLSPVALFALRWPAGRRLMLAALIFLLPYWANIGTRFLLPALPFVALSMALIMERIPGVLPALILAHAVASWPSLVDKYCAGYAWHLDAKIPIRAALRKERQEEYLYRTRLEYRVAKMVEGIVPPGGKVFAFSPIAESYISREIVTGSYSTPGTALREALWVPSVDWMQPVQAVRFPFAERRLRRIRITQTATDASDQWSITEIYFFHGSAELRRESGWKTTAQPNPWESSLALDNSAVTRWNSRQTLKPGMVFEVEFPGLRLLDSVLLRIVADQTNAQMYLEGQTEDGRWELLNRDPQMFELGPPLEMRRMAVEELLARGIGYILVANYDVGLSDFLERADLWGVKLVGEEAGTRLFEIKRPRN